MNQPKKERFKTSVGGQALMEGIMMRGPKQMCCAVRKPDGTIETKLDPTPAHGVWMKIPLVRGAIAMIESMIVGYRYMMYSAQVSMGDDYDPAEEETAFEKWVGEHLGEKAENALLTVAAVLGGLLAILLFTVWLILSIGLTLLLVTVGRRALEFVSGLIALPQGFIDLWSYLRFIVLGVVMFLMLTVLYMLAQGQRRPLKEVAPGVGISLAAWMVLSLAFSYYVEHFANYSVLYGSIATIVVVLLWLYMSGTVLIMGAEYSAVILRRRRSRLPSGSGEEQA